MTVDLTEPAFKCTCPSRKFPCKHGVALLLIWVEHGDAVGEAEQAADFAGEWAAQRGDRAANRAAKAVRQDSEVADPAAQARRQVEREKAMTAGLEELEQWLSDLVRQGLANARRQPYAYWDSMAARLVDAQMPGLADRVRDAAGTVTARDDWAGHLLSECGRWELAVAAWRRRETLGDDVVGDLRAFLGWARRGDETAAFAKARDSWVVAGVRQGEDGRIVSQRTWLWGQNARRWAMVLDFAAAGAALRVAQPVGAVVEDELRLHPGSEPPRATFSGDHAVAAAGVLPEGTTIAAAVDDIATWVAANPWRERLPLVIDQAVAVRDGGDWWLQDPVGDRLPMSRAEEPWMLLALTRGSPATVVVEWDEGRAHPMALRVPDGDAAGEVVPL